MGQILECSIQMVRIYVWTTYKMALQWYHFHGNGRYNACTYCTPLATIPRFATDFAPVPDSDLEHLNGWTSLERDCIHYQLHRTFEFRIVAHDNQWIKWVDECERIVTQYVVDVYVGPGEGGTRGRNVTTQLEFISFIQYNIFHGRIQDKIV